MARELHIESADNQVKRIDLGEDSYSLGRAHTNKLCYPDDASLSRSHMLVEKDGDDWVVSDLGSKNGTLVNGARITGSTKLSPGDRLAAGQLVLRFVDPDVRTEESVVFVPGSTAEMAPGATVMTSLEGLLSSESSGRVEQPQPTPGSQPDQAFGLPIVQALIRAGRELAGHRPLGELFTLILDLSIEAVGAERGVLMTLEGDELVSRAVHGEGFRISTMVRDRVLKEKTSVLVRDIQQDQALLQQLSISEQQIHSLMAVPLQTESDVIGLVYVDSRLFVREFNPDDLNLLTVLANVAAIRINHERFLELRQQEQRRNRDLQQAAEIQRNILPAAPPTIPGLDLAGYNAPCLTVGGDYYDFIPYDDGRWVILVADVAGKGMSAALLVSSLQARVQLLTENPMSPVKLMSRLDHSISVNCPNNRFITMFICVVDPATGETHYCNAGHNPAFLIKASGDVEALTAMGTVLGILPERGYEEAQIVIETGDLIAIYSDGVTEAVNDADEEFGEDRLAQLIVTHRESSAEEIVCAVNDQLTEWTGDAPPDDDITLVIVRRTS
jgi:sigma-B regulation protein RsbU (phosphoserine phosphatase)